MRARRKRFEKLLALRERELEDRRRESARARTALRETRLALERAHAALREASERSRVDEGSARRVDEWTTALDWVQAKTKDVETAFNTHNLARERERITTILVQKAEKEKRKIEKLLERIVLEEQREAIVLEQKETDEIAARKTAPTSAEPH